MKKVLGLVMLGGMLALGGCRVEVDLVLGGQGARGVGRVVVDPILLAYWKDLQVEEAPLFDLARLQSTAARYPGFRFVSLDPEGEGVLSFSFEVEEVRRFLASLERDEVAGSAMDRGLKIKADRDLFVWIFSLVLGDEETAERLLPPPALSPEDMRAYFHWVFEEYATPHEVNLMLDGAALVLRVSADAPVAAVKGGVREGQDAAVFTIPFFPLLAGEEREYEISWE